MSLNKAFLFLRIQVEGFQQPSVYGNWYKLYHSNKKRGGEGGIKLFQAFTKLAFNPQDGLQSIFRCFELTEICFIQPPRWNAVNI